MGGEVGKAGERGWREREEAEPKVDVVVLVGGRGGEVDVLDGGDRLCQWARVRTKAEGGGRGGRRRQKEEVGDAATIYMDGDRNHSICGEIGGYRRKGSHEMGLKQLFV